MRFLTFNKNSRWGVLVMGLCLSSCSGPHVLQSFSSDGCTLFPDGSPCKKQNWRDCCFQHDLAYWKGGTKEERLEADKELERCVLKKTGRKGLAKTMYRGVRLGGSSYFYTWYRWGYGWQYGRFYKALNDGEQKQAVRKLQEYRASQSKPI